MSHLVRLTRVSAKQFAEHDRIDKSLIPLPMLLAKSNEPNVDSEFDFRGVEVP